MNWQVLRNPGITHLAHLVWSEFKTTLQFSFQIILNKIFRKLFTSLPILSINGNFLKSPHIFFSPLLPNAKLSTLVCLLRPFIGVKKDLMLNVKNKTRNSHTYIVDIFYMADCIVWVGVCLRKNLYKKIGCVVIFLFGWPGKQLFCYSYTWFLITLSLWLIFNLKIYF